MPDEITLAPEERSMGLGPNRDLLTNSEPSRRELTSNLLLEYENKFLLERNLLNFIASGSNLSNLDGLTNPNLESQHPSFLNKLTRLIVQHPNRSLLSLLSATSLGLVSGATLSFASGKAEYSYTFAAVSSGAGFISLGFVALAHKIQRYLNNGDVTLNQLSRFRDIQNQLPQQRNRTEEENQTPQTPQILVQLGTVNPPPRDENQTPQTPQILVQLGTVNPPPRDENQTPITIASMGETRSTTPISLSSQSDGGQEGDRNFLESILALGVQGFQGISTSLGTILFPSNRQQEDRNQNPDSSASIASIVFFNSLQERPRNHAMSPLARSAQIEIPQDNNLV